MRSPSVEARPHSTDARVKPTIENWNIRLRPMRCDSQPDSGVIQYRSGIVMSTLEQQLPANEEATVRQVVAEGLADLKELVDEYERLAHQSLDKAGLKRLDDLQHRIDELDGWRIDQRVDLMMTEMFLPPDQPIGELSGGWRRRVGLAKALISKHSTGR